MLSSLRAKRHLRELAVGAIGLALGVGMAATVHLASRPHQATSVQRLDLPGTATAARAGLGAAAKAVQVAPGSARAAVAQYLQAQAKGDAATAFALLDQAGHDRYQDPVRWAAAQADRPPATTVTVTGERPAAQDAADVTVQLSHKPMLDPFLGLVPARSNEVWHAQREHGRWRVDATPADVQAVLPDDHGAPDAVQAWVSRLLACDHGGAAALQATTDLYGPADLADAPCHDRGRWTVAATERFDAAADPQPYVAAFGSDVQTWARLVQVQGPHTRFAVVVAPLGDAWRVLGTDASN